MKDHEFCGDNGMGANCIKTVSKTSREIPKDQWDKERFGMVCMGAEAFADWKVKVIKWCNENQCSKGDKETK